MSRAVWSDQQVELLVDAVSSKRAWTAGHGKVTEVWEEVTALVRAQWPTGIKQPDRKAVQAKYKEIVERVKRRQATANGRSGDHEEQDEPWLRTLLDNIEAADEHEMEARLGKVEKEEKDREVQRRHAQLRDDAMRTLSEKRERQDRQGSSSESDEGSGKKQRLNIRGLLRESMEQSSVRHKEQMEAHDRTQQTLQNSVELINSTLQQGNDLFAQFLQQQKR